MRGLAVGVVAPTLWGRSIERPDQILAEVDRRWGRWKMLAANYLFEDLFWRNQHEPLPWLTELIRR